MCNLLYNNSTINKSYSKQSRTLFKKKIIFINYLIIILLFAIYILQFDNSLFRIQIYNTIIVLDYYNLFNRLRTYFKSILSIYFSSKTKSSFDIY